MSTATIKYIGDLRTEARHNESGTVIYTDAPKDNHGKGEAFSPTDLLATSLASCMISIMGIVARTHSIDLGTIEAEMNKIMFADPRRVGRIEIKIRFLNGPRFDEKTRQILVRAGMTCPVFLSLHPDMEKEIEWIWE